MNKRDIIDKLLADEAKASHMLGFSLFEHDPDHPDSFEFDAESETIILCVRSDAYGDVYVYENYEGDFYAYLKTGGHDYPLDDLRDTHQHLYLFIRKQLRR